MALSKNQRLSREHFILLSRGGRLYHTPFFAVRVVFRGTDCGEQSRFSIVVSRKTSPKAVDRNRIKRRISAVLREFAKKTKPCFLGVFYLKKAALDASSEELKKSISSALKKSGVFFS